tara:strand:- start:651 stop:1421 length:771 start_codon:yes stop_codon:yes gene_type:complete
MAFKMKGSPFQRNFGIGGPAKLKKDDSAMKMKKDSAMDMKDPIKMKKESPMDMKTSMKMKKAAMKMGEKSPMKAAKPDYPDIDGDGNTTESMKQAAADKKSPAKQGYKKRMPDRKKPGDLTESELRKRKGEFLKNREKKANEKSGERSRNGLKTESLEDRAKRAESMKTRSKEETMEMLKKKSPVKLGKTKKSKKGGELQKGEAFEGHFNMVPRSQYKPGTELYKLFQDSKKKGYQVTQEMIKEAHKREDAKGTPK